MQTRYIYAAGAVLALVYILFLFASPTPEGPPDAATAPEGGAFIRKVD